LKSLLMGWATVACGLPGTEQGGGWQSQSAEAELAETDRASDSAPGE